MSIKTIAELIERIEAVKQDIHVRSLSLTEYEQVGWAVRPLNALLERCREEADAIAWAEQARDRERLAAALMPSLLRCPVGNPNQIGESSA